MATANPGNEDSIPERDLRVLRELAKRKAEIAALPIQRERIKLWTKLNMLASIRPMVWIFEIPWNEMEVGEELKLQCSDPLCQSLERALRHELYQWDYMPGDLVVQSFIPVPPVVHDTGDGLWEKVDIAKTDETSSVVSRRYHIQIRDESDVEKIKFPEVTLDEAAWDRNHAMLNDIFNGILPVEKVGMKGMSIAPWDLLVRLTGVEEILMDMHTRPQYVHRIIDRLFAAHLHRLGQYEKLNLLDLNNETVSGGGPQYTDDLPPVDCDPKRIRPQDMWGRTMSQIFSEVSPAMHEEFALQYECRWLNRFGLTYYGCCEPLHKKVDILRKNVSNLRKISMSPWIDLDEAADNVGADYVFSLKPNPAVFIENNWDTDFVRSDLRRTLDRLRGMHVEIIMKDISTVRYQPKHLWEWARIASEVAEEFAS
ncbi:MAG: hypothetical protein HY318_19020 [Armatimonadetes bacterium]|nr:hypothetical protein [Armatimonadota bacterium]